MQCMEKRPTKRAVAVVVETRFLLQKKSLLPYKHSIQHLLQQHVSIHLKIGMIMMVKRTTVDGTQMVEIVKHMVTRQRTQCTEK